MIKKRTYYEIEIPIYNVPERTVTAVVRSFFMSYGIIPEYDATSKKVLIKDCEIAESDVIKVMSEVKILLRELGQLKYKLDLLGLKA